MLPVRNNNYQYCLFKLHLSICSPTPDCSAENPIPTSWIYIWFVGFPTTPQLPLTFLWTAGCHLFHADWWQQGEHQGHGKHFPTPVLLPPWQCSTEEHWEEQLQLQNLFCIPRHRLIISVKFSTKNTTRILKEQEAQMSPLQMEYLAKNACQTLEFHNSGEQLIFSKRQLPDSTLLLYPCPALVPSLMKFNGHAPKY